METRKERNAWQWNPDCLVENRQGNALVLRNDISGILIMLSKPEYDLLQAYVTDNSYNFVSEAMSGYEIDNETFMTVTEKARQLDIVVPMAVARARTGRCRRQSVFKMKAVFLANMLVSFFQHFTTRPLKAECSGNLRFFRLCSMNLEGGLINRIATNRHFQLWLPACLFLFLAVLAVTMAFTVKDFQFAGFGMENISVWPLYAAMAVSIFVCLLWHECGHYLVYKRYGGTDDCIGIGTMFGFFPVLYTKVNDMHIWTDHNRRLILTVAGIMADLVAFMVLCIILSTCHKATFLTLLTDCLFFYYIVQIITNLNIFIPGTDGYYLLEEITHRERLYGRAFETARVFWKGVTHCRMTLKTFRQWLLLGYYLLCCLCITVYWAFAVLWFTFPFWGEIIL